MLTVRIAGTIPESIVDGPGFRFALFTQGCPHHCPGCHNPQTHDPNGGREVSLLALMRLRNRHPAFQGDLEILDSPDHQLSLRRRYDGETATLQVDLLQKTLDLRYSQEGRMVSLF